MLGHKAREFKQHQSISLEDLVPDDNFYRQVQHRIDLGFVRELVDEFYASMGRPSIDPVVLFKLQLIAFFEGIRSERQLMETVNLHLAHRWFIGYDLDEPVPDHSSLSKVRERYGLEVFQQFFEQIVELCIEAGLVWGEELYFDSTKVQANASINSMMDRAKFEAHQHLDQLFEHSKDDPSGFGKMIAKYNGKRLNGIRKPHYHRITDDQVSPIDPDSAPMQLLGRGSAVLGYRDHYVVDGGKARIILSALVTPASIMDNTPILDLVDWVCSRWRLTPKIATGDVQYGTVPNIVGLEGRGIKAYLPTSDFSHRTKYYSAKLFQYDSEKDQYVCPQGQILPLVSQRRTEQVLVYKPKAEMCNACPVKGECTGSKSGRHIFRSFFQEYLDTAETYRQTDAYMKAIRKRSVWVEPVFGEAKEFHRLRRFRLRRLLKVNIEGVMVAAGQNLKRLIKHHLAVLFSFLKFPSQCLISSLFLTFSTAWYIILITLMVVFLTASCGPKQVNPTTEAGMPSPASVYCEEHDGRLDIRQAASGGQISICVFPNKSECEEWAYFRGECAPANSTTTAVPTSAASEFPTPMTIDPADYQGGSKFTQSVCGFSLLLPEDWTVDESATDLLLSGHLLTIHPKDNTLKSNIRMTFRRAGEDVLLWPTGAGDGEFTQQGSLDIAGKPARRVLLVCPNGQITSIWYQGETDANIQRGDLEFGFIFSSSKTHCQEGHTLEGKTQQVGEMIIASLAVP